MFLMLVLMSAIFALTAASSPFRSSTSIVSLHGVVRGRARPSRLVPLDLDAPLGVVEQVDDVGAGRGVDRHALAAGDVADDLLAADRIAAPRAEDQHVVEAARP